MDPKELIERLKYNGCEGCPHRQLCAADDTAECTIRVEAAAVITALVEGNAQLRAELEDKKDAADVAIALNLQYLKELERVKRERDAYEFCSKDLLSKGNCNECGSNENCTYRPGPGETVRANCPLWRDPMKEE